MSFRAAFDCLWCGNAHICRGPDDLEGWAQLCPDCVGKAGDNGFLRFRLHQALTERGSAKAATSGATLAPARAARAATPAPSPDRPTAPAAPFARPTATVDPASAAAERKSAATELARTAERKSAATELARAAERTSAATEPAPCPAIEAAPIPDLDAEMRAYYEARAPEYDDWYLRRGRYERGPVHDAAWNAELDVAGRWLDALPIRGEIIELAAGTGWWSPLLASKGDLSLYDAASAPLDRARERLVAHRLRAHLHVRDAWAEPDRAVDSVFTGFWLSHVQRDRLDAFLAIVRRWLKPGGTYAFIDSLADPQSSAADHSPPVGDRSLRRLDDGREFTIVKVYYEPAELEGALIRAGFANPTVTTTGRFFLTGTATAS
jgi:SAM-dependent methyltransferase